MDNRILDICIEDHSLDPATAEVWITVTPERLTPTTEVRGRLMGPICPYASTVEVAYPLTRLRRPDTEAATPEILRLRAVIPEPSLWDTQSPFLYGGPLELWQDGRCCDRLNVRHGLRRLSLGPHGLRVSGRLTSLKGLTWEADFPERAPDLHAHGYNALLAPLRADTLDVWDVADRFGFLVLGRLDADTRQTAHLLQRVGRHPSSFGWVVGPEDLADGCLEQLIPMLPSEGLPLIGVEMSEAMADALPETVQFVLCREGLSTGPARRPLLVLGGTDVLPPDGFPPLLGRIEP